MFRFFFPQVAIVLVLTVAANGEETKEKRGLAGLGYGGYGYGGYGYGAALGYGHGLGYAPVASAPLSHISQISYSTAHGLGYAAAPALGYGHGLSYAAAPAITKVATYAAPALSYGHGLGYSGYGGYGYAAPAYSLGYGGYGYH